MSFLQVLGIFLDIQNKENVLYDNVENMQISFDNSYLINAFDLVNALNVGVTGGFISKKTASETTTFGSGDELKRIESEKEKEMEEQKALFEQQATLQNNNQQNSSSQQKSSSSKRDGGSTQGDLRQKMSKN